MVSYAASNKPDVIRTARGAVTTRVHPEACATAIEIAVKAHGIETLIFQGPSSFHDHQINHLGRLKLEMIDDLREAVNWAETQFPSLLIDWDFDDDLFDMTDWHRPRRINRLYTQCMDVRLNHWLGRIYNAHESSAMLIRWPGSLSAMVDPLMSKCLQSEFRLISDYLIGTGQILPAFEPTNHEDCAYIKGLALEHLTEPQKHHWTLAEALSYVRDVFDGFEICPQFLRLNGEVAPFRI